MTSFRILHIGKFFPPFFGGIENFLADLMEAQKQQGDEVAAVVHDHRIRWNRFFAPAQTEQSVYQTLYRVPSYGRLLYAPVSPQFPFWLKHAVHEFKPHLLHLHLPNTSAFFTSWFSSARSIPWVIHWHSDVTSEIDKRLALAYYPYRFFEQRLLNRAQAVIATSPPYLASSVALQPWQAKCHVVPLGLALTRLPEPSAAAINWAESQWQPKKVRILNVGRLTYYKGQTVLIQAMAQVENAQTLIVGEGEQRPHLENLIVQLGLNTRVKLLGRCSQDELIGLLATCDCFCLPSLERTEAFGMVLLEAARYAKPVVASAILGSGITWVVENGKTGILVPPHDSDALAIALQQMVANPSLRQQLGHAGFQRIHETFAMPRIAEAVRNVYQSINSPYATTIS